MSSLKSQARKDWRWTALHIGLGLALIATIAIAAWAVDSLTRSEGWSLTVLAAVFVVGAVAIGALVGIGGSHLSRELALGLAALSMLVYGAAVVMQWDATPGSVDCPGADDCEHGFAVGGIFLAIAATPFGVIGCFALHELIGRARRRFLS